MPRRMYGRHISFNVSGRTRAGQQTFSLPADEVGHRGLRKTSNTGLLVATSGPPPSRPNLPPFLRAGRVGPRWLLLATLRTPTRLPTRTLSPPPLEAPTLRACARPAFGRPGSGSRNRTEQNGEPINKIALCRTGSSSRLIAPKISRHPTMGFQSMNTAVRVGYRNRLQGVEIEGRAETQPQELRRLAS